MNVAPYSSSHSIAGRIGLCLLAGLLACAAEAVFAPATDRNHNSDSSGIYDASKAAARTNRSDSGNFTLANGSSVQYVGMYSADTKFRKPSRINRLSDSDGPRGSNQRSAPQRLLRSKERALETVAPPARASAAAPHEGVPGRTLSNLATLVYGHLQVMQLPQTIVTDSRQRVIVADPAIPAIHVLDPHGKTSFRIVGGAGRRFQSAEHVDVDVDDNIYLADPVRSLVLVFDRDGRFLREIGTYRGETLFERITAIAIDRGASRLYVADGPRSEIVVLDLRGNLLMRAGQGRMESRLGELMRRDPLAPQQFSYPTDIAVAKDKVIVLDSEGTRVHLMDHDCKPLGSFSVQRAAKDKAYGISLDRRGDIFVLYSDAASIRAYNAEGGLLGAFGYPGLRAGEFLSPEGMWIDGADRLYVADSGNSRVELFQLTSTQ